MSKRARETIEAESKELDADLEWDVLLHYCVVNEGEELDARASAVRSRGNYTGVAAGTQFSAAVEAVKQAAGAKDGDDVRRLAQRRNLCVWAPITPQASQHVCKKDEEYFFRVTRGGGGSETDWTDVVRLSDEQKKFVDKFLRGDISLPHMNTGVAQVPMFSRIPSMLLFQLRREDFTHAADVDACVRDAEACLQNIAVVAGTPGCGKTRSIYDLLSNEFGLYFVMSTELNGGSQDMSEAVATLSTWLTLGDPAGDNRKVVGVYMMLLLACRMAAYQYCRAAGATPLQWLLLQAAGRGLEAGHDLFLDMFRQASGVLPKSRAGVCAQWNPLFRMLKLKSDLRIVALDEAQIAVSALAKECFRLDSRSWVPLINPLVEALKNGGRVVLLSGTGFTLLFERDMIPPSGEKMVAAPNRFVQFSGWSGPEQMVEFAQRVVELSEEDRELLESPIWGVYPKLSGRYRPFCDVLQVMLLKKMKLGEAAQYVIQAQSTKSGKPEFPKSLYKKVSELAKREMRNGISLISELETAVVQYFSMGRGWHIQAGDRGVEVIEAGIGKLVTDDYAAEISEYLVLLTGRNFFEDEYGPMFLPNAIFKQFCQASNPSIQGLSYQNYVAAFFEAKWKEYQGSMASMPLFKALLDHPACPAAFKTLSARHGKLREGLWSTRERSDRYPLLSYLADLKHDRQLCTSYICEDKYGVDVVRAAVFDDGTMIYFTDQQKLRSQELSVPQALDAIHKSGFTDEDVIRLLSDIRVQFVYVFPQVWPSHLPSVFWDGNVGVLVIHADNGPDIFGETIAEHFRVLKDGKGGAMHLENTYIRSDMGP